MQKTKLAETWLYYRLTKNEGVLDVAVVGVHDDRAGQLPRAFIVR